MISKRRRAIGVGLLAFLLIGAAAPAAAVLVANSCCPGMAAADRSEVPPTRCQWMIATSCCDESTLAGSILSLVPAPGAERTLAATPPPLLQHPLRLPAAVPDPRMAALAKTVLLF